MTGKAFWLAVLAGGLVAGVLDIVYAFVSAGMSGRTRWIASGVAFGVLVYLFMNFVVIPLSAAPFGPSWTVRAFVQGFISHALVFGLPISWCLHRAATKLGPGP